MKNQWFLGKFQECYKNNLYSSKEAKLAKRLSHDNNKKFKKYTIEVDDWFDSDLKTWINERISNPRALDHDQSLPKAELTTNASQILAPNHGQKKPPTSKISTADFHYLFQKFSVCWTKHSSYLALAIKCQWDTVLNGKFNPIPGWLAVDVNFFYLSKSDLWKYYFFGSV